MARSSRSRGPTRRNPRATAATSKEKKMDKGDSRQATTPIPVMTEDEDKARTAKDFQTTVGEDVEKEEEETAAPEEGEVEVPGMEESESSGAPEITPDEDTKD
jgi:hypothetical protein